MKENIRKMLNKEATDNVNFLSSLGKIKPEEYQSFHKLFTDLQLPVENLLIEQLEEVIRNLPEPMYVSPSKDANGDTQAEFYNRGINAVFERILKVIQELKWREDYVDGYKHLEMKME